MIELVNKAETGEYLLKAHNEFLQQVVIACAFHIANLKTTKVLLFIRTAHSYDLPSGHPFGDAQMATLPVTNPT